MLASASKRTPHPIPLPRRGLGGERVPGGRVRGVLHGPKFLRGYIARSEHEAQAGGFASATAFGLRRLVALLSASASQAASHRTVPRAKAPASWRTANAAARQFGVFAGGPKG